MQRGYSMLIAHVVFASIETGGDRDKKGRLVVGIEIVGSLRVSQRRKSMSYEDKP
jgi:hypothetical protein